MNELRRNPVSWLPLGATEWGMLAAIFVVVVLTALADSNHTYWNNPKPMLVDMLRQTAFLGVVALGAGLVIIAGGIDLSIGSMMCFGGAVCACLLVLLAPEAMKYNRPVANWVVAVAIAGAIGSGILVGTLHTWLITVVRLPPFVTTLATLVGLRSLAWVMCENVTDRAGLGKSTQIQLYPEQIQYIAKSVWLPVVILCVLSVALWFLLSRTVVGRHIYAVGGNEQAARLSGIRTENVKWLVYCLCAVLGALGGVFYIGEETLSDPEKQARGMELNAIAAAVLGGCSLAGGVGSVPGIILGVVFLRVVMKGVQLIIKTNATAYEGLVVGCVVVVAVAFAQLREALRSGTRIFPGAVGVCSLVTLSLLLGLVTMQAAPWQVGVGVGLVALCAFSGIKVWEVVSVHRPAERTPV